MHRIASTAIDAGPVIAVRMAEPLPGESVLSASARLHALGAEMVLEIVGDLARSLDQATAQSAAGASYEGFPDRAVLAAARARGIRLV